MSPRPYSCGKQLSTRTVVRAPRLARQVPLEQGGGLLPGRDNDGNPMAEALLCGAEVDAEVDEIHRGVRQVREESLWLLPQERVRHLR